MEKFLAKTYGLLVFSIYLDKLRYPSCCIPTFFIHNLLRGGINLTATYSTVAIKGDAERR